MEKQNKEKKEQTPLEGDQNGINETKTGCHKNPVGGTQMTEIDLTQIKPREAKAESRNLKLKKHSVMHRLRQSTRLLGVKRLQGLHRGTEHSHSMTLIFGVQDEKTKRIISQPGERNLTELLRQELARREKNAFLTIFEEIALQVKNFDQVLKKVYKRKKEYLEICAAETERPATKRNCSSESSGSNQSNTPDSEYNTLEDNKELSQEIEQLKKEIILLNNSGKTPEIQSNTEDKCAEYMKTQLLQRRKRQLKRDEP
ncbi:hypothetical protein JTB14_013096 [Gonioctena quinquepunctata]|nr:hypothetical protein JTB14_013096 [Gonioctena quinquepunctata]